MSRALRFIIALVVGLGLITWVASVLVQRTTRGWFERDLALRAQLAVSGAARAALISQWRESEPANLQDLLVEITHDERIMAAAACDSDLTLRAQTPDFPDRLSCEQIGAHVRSSGSGAAAEWTSWKEVRSLPGGNVHVSAIPLLDRDRPLGFVVLVHDLSFVERREAKARQFLLLAFGFLAVAASVVTLIAARLSWRNWTRELRRFLRSGAARPEFQPLMRDVRELVERIVADEEAEREGGVWTPERLKRTLRRYLQGEKVVIIANREPYIHERLRDGAGFEVLHPASGLVTALEPVMRACSGTWIAHGGGSADRETADRHARLRVPPGEESYLLRRVWLSPEEEKGYYYGFANEGLWPLCHMAHTRPIFRSEDWKYYRNVNQKFADALTEEVDSEDPIVLVQDYHFTLAPRLIREHLPRATVIMFWHIPWANSQRFGICPWRKDLIEGMLGASILGFHTQGDCNSFLDSVDCFLEARIDREQSAVVQRGRNTLVRAYPISLDWPNRWVTSAPPVDACRAGVFQELHLGCDALLGIGVDRLDYTKGIEERLLAVERLLERFPPLRGRFTFVQLAAPSRTVIERYRALSDNVEQLAARINQRFGTDNYRPIVLRHAHHEPPSVFRYYRAADLCYVSSLHDGMNLVAKEFVAARDDDDGVLVLSRLAGAAQELREAVIINPYDVDGFADSLLQAIDMPLEERRARMRAMRRVVAGRNVFGWASDILEGLESLWTKPLHYSVRRWEDMPV
jgi:trehalose 6-phosphate synthase